MGAFSCCLVVVTAADRAAATFTALGYGQACKQNPQRLPPQRELSAVRLTEDHPLPTQKPDGLLSHRASFTFFSNAYSVISNNRAAVFAGNVTFSFVPSIANVQSPVEG